MMLVLRLFSENIIYIRLYFFPCCTALPAEKSIRACPSGMMGGQIFRLWFQVADDPIPNHCCTHRLTGCLSDPHPFSTTPVVGTKQANPSACKALFACLKHRRKRAVFQFLCLHRKASKDDVRVLCGAGQGRFAFIATYAFSGSYLGLEIATIAMIDQQYICDIADGEYVIKTHTCHCRRNNQGISPETGQNAPLGNPFPDNSYSLGLMS